MWLQACHGEGTCQLIFIKTVRDDTDKANDLVISVDRNKNNILEAITLCLEQPLCNMLQEWSQLYSEDSDILADIQTLYTLRLNHNDEADTSEVPDNIKRYLSGYFFSHFIMRRYH